ncbi:SRPBCC family protein [Psychromarinibacter sp. C21-152]|uniref:SRPBCC family protein n=1 Tax=Psychromarinibacter sediminicola TaxID=3033385 RepID=A0AAE3NMR4_9RHOB|nr:SRPBCC family protein [Psychromarinibacter sediminicola]MDF0600768.1 SRPBCC family protein [Psychromarinibacter sediminicola]
MKLSTREDIEAPIEHVWSRVTNFDGFERQALRRGAEVVRNDTMGAPGLGSEWDITYTFRGRPREIDARVATFDAPTTLRLEAQSGGLDGTVQVELVSLSPRRTRMQLSLEMAPRNLSGRLLVQSLKFARGNMEKRFKGRVYDYAQTVEASYRKAG